MTDGEDTDEDEADPVELPRLKSLSEALTCVGDICDFLESRTYAKVANNSNALRDKLVKLYCTSQTKQTANTDYSFPNYCIDCDSLAS